MDPLFFLALATVAVVLLFDYTNGFHDAANIVATVIASRAMTPAQAVVVVGVFEFLGPLLGGTAVADTIGSFVHLDGVEPVLSLAIVLCGLLGAIVWNLGTWFFGIPSSSSTPWSAAWPAPSPYPSAPGMWSGAWRSCSSTGSSLASPRS